jgi:FAD/FMN-containing dehydrogenase
MQRRKLLQTAAALPLLSCPAGLLAKPAAAPPFRRVRPGEPGWPAPGSWRELNELVGGNLQPVPALAAACAQDPAGAACQELTASLRNPFYIGDQPGGTQVSGWLDAWTPAVSAYALKARHSADVAAGVKFAREHRLRLVVKGGGHSYQGTSNAADSLLIWTRALNEVTLHDAFVPRGCGKKVQPVTAVSAGAGCMWIDLYHAVTSQAGRYVAGGGCTSVGVAGLVQSGGFSSFSKAFGTAAAGLLEAEVVSADGGVRIVNDCTDPELFWAIKGGGGGSWGVITRLTLRTHELPAYFGAAWGRIKAQSDDAFRTLLARFFDFYAASLFNPHWGEQVTVGSDNTLKISMVSQGLDKAQTQALWEPFFAWVKAAPQDYEVAEEFGVGALAAQRWWDVGGTHRLVRDARPGVPDYHAWWSGDQDQVGAFLHGYDSLWLPATLLAPDERARLVAALYAGSRHKDIGLHFNKGLAGAPPEAIAAALRTATNPELTRSFALVIIADGEGAAYPGLKRAAPDLAAAHQNARAIERATAQVRRIAPAGGSYVSESNFFNAHWGDAFWGRNYARLREIKRQHDPDGLFISHHGVGSEEWSADGFTRLA